MSAVRSVDPDVDAGAGCVEAVEAGVLTEAWAPPFVATAVAGGSPWLGATAGVDVTAVACGAGAGAAGTIAAGVVAGAVTVAERTLAVTLPEPAELVVDPVVGVAGATCADTVGAALPGVALTWLEAVALAAGTLGFAGVEVGCEVRIPLVIAGDPAFAPGVIVGAPGAAVAPCATVTVRGFAAAA